MDQIIFPLILVLAFLGVVALVQALAGIVFANRDRNQRVNRRLSMLGSGMESRQVYEALLRRPAVPKVGSAWAMNALERANNIISQAGLTISVLQLSAIVGGVAMLFWVTATMALQRSGAGVGPRELLVALFGSCVITFLGAWMFVSGRRNKRLKQLEAQLPLALDIVIRALKAGHPVISAVNLVTEEMGDPIGSEFGLIVDETTYGAEFREALTNFAQRTGSEDAHFFSVSVGIQSDTGGNLAEILANLSAVIRARQTLGKRIKALSSEGRMSGMILSGLPIFLIGVIGMSQPRFYTAKFDDPIFWPTVGGILSLYCLGLFIMNRITNFKY
jgi:tight adherence protein B